MIREKLKGILSLPIIRYMLNSILVCFIDTAVVWVLYQIMGINLVTANSIGVVTGFVVHYLLSSKSVFQTKFGWKGFCIYFGTFLFGLVMADWLIYTGDHYFFVEINRDLRFLFNKGISVVIPFFVLYFIRKHLFAIQNRKTINK